MICNCACRCVLMIFNSLVLIIGGIMTTIGALMIWYKPATKFFFNGSLNLLLKHFGSEKDKVVEGMLERLLTTTAPIGWAIFIMGAIIAGIALVGFTGACCNMEFLLKIYAVLMLLCDAVLVIIIIVYFTKKDTVANLVLKQFQQATEGYVSIQANTWQSLMVAFIQPPLKCCGYNSLTFPNISATDTYASTEYTGLTLPIPCCKMDSNYVITGLSCPAAFTSENSYIDTPCEKPLKEKFLHYMNIVAYLLIGVVIVIALLIVFVILTIKIDLI